ncbi:hypothetical protein D3C78_1183600 [compost metagenome]
MLLDLVVVLDVVRIAWSAVVSTANRPFAGSVVVADHVIAIAVAKVDNLVHVIFRLVVEHRATRASTAAVRIPVEVRVEAPVAVETVFILQSIWRHICLCVIASTPVDTRQLNLTVFEVECLANAETLTLKAVFFNPTVSDTKRQFVFVTYTISAAEAVIAEQRRVVECALTGIKDRYVELVAVWDVQVEQAWFKRLGVVLAEPLGFTVEEQATVHTENRNVAALVSRVLTV